MSKNTTVELPVFECCADGNEQDGGRHEDELDDSLFDGSTEEEWVDSDHDAFADKALDSILVARVVLSDEDFGHVGVF